MALESSADAVPVPQRFGVPEALWAIALGAVSGAAAAFLRLVFRGLQWLFMHRAGSLPFAAATLPAWSRVFIPVAGALMATLLIAYRHRHATRLGRQPRDFVDYVGAVRLEHGRIPLVPNLWRTAASALSVSTGAAIGREGSMMQFAAATTSAMARQVCRRWPKAERFSTSLSVACGVAGSVATAYQAPVAAVFFAAEIVVGEFHATELIALTFSSVAGWLVSRAILGGGPLYPLSTGGSVPFKEMVVLALLALVIGALGPVYQRSVRMFAAARKLPLALVWAGLLVGLFSLLDVRVWGNGDVGLNAALGLAQPAEILALAKPLLMLLALRLLATSFCAGAGTVGGVFTPTLFAGAVLGSLAARMLHAPHPALLAVFGMGCLIAAVTHAPIMAALMAVELTGDWRSLPWILGGCLISWRIARWLSPESLYAIATQQPLSNDVAGTSAHSEP